MQCIRFFHKTSLPNHLIRFCQQPFQGSSEKLGDEFSSCNFADYTLFQNTTLFFRFRLSGELRSVESWAMFIWSGINAKYRVAVTTNRTSYFRISFRVVESQLVPPNQIYDFPFVSSNRVSFAGFVFGSTIKATEVSFLLVFLVLLFLSFVAFPTFFDSNYHFNKHS